MLSIIIPAHNEGKIIKKTINHLMPLLNDGEIIVVCDSCTDNTLEQAKHVKVKTITVNHQSAALTRNSGAEIASGDYLLFLDADTIIVDPNTIKKSIELLKNPNIKVIGSYWHTLETPPGCYIYNLLVNSFLYLTDTCPGFFLLCRKHEFIPFKTNDKNEDVIWCKEMGRVYHLNGEVETSMRRLQKYGLFKTLQFYNQGQSCDLFKSIIVMIMLFIIIIIMITYIIFKFNILTYCQQ